jgi:hypothetical protein
MTTRKTLEQLTNESTAKSLPDLKLGLARMESIREALSTMSLGESSRRNTIAAASSTLDPLTKDSRKEIAKLLPSIEIIKLYKRKALIKIGNLTVVIGKYGVASYYMPTGISVSILNKSIESFFDSNIILDYIGAVIDSRERGESIYNYSQCTLPGIKTIAG